jgi:hypothetical protein
MAGYTEALASVLYPNTNDESAFYLGGQGISQMRLPQFESPWQNFLAAGLQNLVGLGMKGYGARLTNQANAENAAQMIPQLGNLGVSVTPEIQSGLTSTDPQKRALALALTERQMSAADAVRKSDAEFADFKRKELFKDSLDDDKRIGELDRNRQAYESQLRGEVNQLQPKKSFEIADQYFKASVNSALRNDKGSDLNLISNLAKMRDPTSVVREGEVTLTKDTQDFLDKVAGGWRGVAYGTSTLGPDTRSKILLNAKDYWDAARGAYEQQASQYEKVGVSRGLAPDSFIMLPYKQDAYADFLKSVPSEDIIRKAFDQQKIAEQMAQMQPRIEVGPLGATSSETVPVMPLPAAQANQEYKQVGPNTYIRITKGK